MSDTPQDFSLTPDEVRRILVALEQRADPADGYLVARLRTVRPSVDCRPAYPTTYETEADVLRRVLKALAGAGLYVYAVRVHGEEYPYRTSFDMLRAGDTFTMHVATRSRDQVAGAIVVIPGQGEDIVSDYTWRDGTVAGRLLVEALEGAGF